MSRPRNNLSEMRGKLPTSVLAGAPAQSSAQGAKAFKFKTAMSAQAAASFAVVPHAAHVGPPEPTSISYLTQPPARMASGLSSTRKAQKRSSLEGPAPTDDKPTPPKKQRIMPAAAVPSRLATPMSDDVPTGTSPTPRSPRKAITSSVHPPRTAAAHVNLQANLNPGSAQSMTIPQLWTRLASGLSTELEQTRALANGGDPELLQEIIAVCATRNDELRTEIQRREQGGELRPSAQAKTDLSTMSIEQLRIFLVQSLNTELDQTKKLLSSDADIILIEACINIASKRNVDIREELRHRESLAPGPLPAKAQSLPSTILASTTRLQTFSSADIITTIDDVDEMEVDIRTTSKTIVTPRGQPLRPIENVIDVETTTNVHTPVKERPSAPPRPTSPEPDTLAKNSPYVAEARKVLKKKFHLDNFRRNQLAAVTATLEGKDVFVLMPTGGGKSLCYQLPAVVSHAKTGGVTVVISPLIALMTDQVDHLVNNGIDAFAFNSNNDTAAQNKAKDRLYSCADLPALIYITPEKLQKNESFKNVLKKLQRNSKLARFVIDEAHCFATWGRDFRDAYLDLTHIRDEYPNVPLMALTATAKKNNVNDIITKLNMTNCVRLTQSFNRSNLCYVILRKESKPAEAIKQISDVIKRHPGETGIVYCLARDECERVAKDLRDVCKVAAMHYHAKMEPTDKTRIQQQWQKGECKIIVATIAFGMGIDKSNVRFVVHQSLPKSFEGYYQETGRAGRDGQESECVLLYSQKDFQRIRNMIWKDDKNAKQVTSVDEKKRQEEDARVVMRFCLNDMDCRRAQVLNYFGETFDSELCDNHCDNCIASLTSGCETRDFTLQAQDAVRLAQEAIASNIQITQTQLGWAFSGSQNKEVKSKGLDRLKSFGKGASMDKKQAGRLFDYLFVEGALTEEAVKNGSGWSNSYVKMGHFSNVNKILQGKHPLEMTVRTGSGVHITMAGGKKSAKAQRQPKAALKTVKVKPPKHQEDPYSDDAEENGTPSTSSRSRHANFIADDDPIELADNDIEDDWDFSPEEIEAFDPRPKTPPRPAALQGDIDELDPHQRLHRILFDKRSDIARQKRIPASDILPDEALQMLAVLMPADSRQFKRTLQDQLGEQAGHRVAEDCEPLLSICIAFSMEFLRPKPQPVAVTSSSSATGLSAATMSKFKFRKA